MQHDFDALTAAAVLNVTPERMVGWHVRGTLPATSAESQRRRRYDFASLMAGLVRVALQSHQAPLLRRESMLETVRQVQQHKGSWAGAIVAVHGMEARFLRPDEPHSGERFEGGLSLGMIAKQLSEKLDRLEAERQRTVRTA